MFVNFLSINKTQTVMSGKPKEFTIVTFYNSKKFYKFQSVSKFLKLRLHQNQKLRTVNQPHTQNSDSVFQRLPCSYCTCKWSCLLPADGVHRAEQMLKILLVSAMRIQGVFLEPLSEMDLCHPTAQCSWEDLDLWCHSILSLVVLTEDE